MNFKLLFSFFALTVSVGGLRAETRYVRITEAEDTDSSVANIIQKINQQTGFNLRVQDFVSVEDRSLATSHFSMLSQSVAGTMVHGAQIRIWKNPATSALIQAEAHVENPQPLQQIAAIPPAAPLAKNSEVTALVAGVVMNHEDSKPFQIVKSTRYWKDGQRVQVVRVRARRGYHTVTVSLTEKKVLTKRYDEFPQDDFSLQADLYPIYEEVEGSGERLPRVRAELKYLKGEVRRANGQDPYAALNDRSYFESMFDPVRGATAEGQQQGYWSMAVVNTRANEIRDSYPLVANSFDNGGVILEGRYATVNIHPGAASLANLPFALQPSLQFRPDWKLGLNGGRPDFQMIPSSTFLGKTILSQEEALARPARRLDNHDPVAYMGDGFDELQVYYSVNTMMESLHSMGFADPELSTRPFHAFLYDPDISMRDNAYYTNDTINFTTYSSKAPNYARDNSTIWHELGHGVMDRLMGEGITLADTGGLSEGMADFLASLVIADKMEGQVYPGMNNYRIRNRTGFHLTNEVHDDGEAYGGAMEDLKNAAIAAQGRVGLHKVTDLTMEAMRLTRNHPGLTAAGWFEHMLFADSRGSEVRAKGEMKDLILTALNGRNFSLDANVALASFSLKNGNAEVASGETGSRQAPLSTSIRATETKTFDLKATLKDGDFYKFQYPVKVKVFYQSGPLQGAVDWVGEDSEPLVATLNASGDTVNIPVSVKGQCDAVNREDGTCVDYAYVQIWNNDAAATQPVAKKRFYLKIRTKN